VYRYAFGTPLAEKSKSRANQQADRLDNYSVYHLKYAMNILNDRPRKRLEFFTPDKFFLKRCVAFNC